MSKKPKLPEGELIDIKDIPPPKGGIVSKIAPTIMELLKTIPEGQAYKFVETEELKATSVNGFLKRKHKNGKLLKYTFTQRKINGKTTIFIKHLPKA